MTEVLTEFIVENIRCFRGEQRGRLAPITLLVGENSTGKTTFLSSFSILCQWWRIQSKITPEPDFNLDPFTMGSFQEIVNMKNESGHSVDEFKIGVQISNPVQSDASPYRLTITFQEHDSHPLVKSIELQFDEESFLELKRSNVDKLILAIPNTKVETDFSFEWAYDMFDLNIFYNLIELEDQGSFISSEVLPQTVETCVC